MGTYINSWHVCSYLFSQQMRRAAMGICVYISICSLYLSVFQSRYRVAIRAACIQGQEGLLDLLLNTLVNKPRFEFLEAVFRNQWCELAVVSLEFLKCWHVVHCLEGSGMGLFGSCKATQHPFIQVGEQSPDTMWNWGKKCFSPGIYRWGTNTPRKLRLPE